MFLYVIKRLLYLIPLLMGITFIVFLLTSTLPGDPALSLVGERASPEVLENIRKDIAVFRTLTAERFNSVKSAGVGSVIDQKYDDVFLGIVHQILRDFPVLIWPRIR